MRLLRHRLLAVHTKVFHFIKWDSLVLRRSSIRSVTFRASSKGAKIHFPCSYQSGWINDHLYSSIQVLTSQKPSSPGLGSHEPSQLHLQAAALLGVSCLCSPARMHSSQSIHVVSVPSTGKAQLSLTIMASPSTFSNITPITAKFLRIWHAPPLSVEPMLRFRRI